MRVLFVCTGNICRSPTAEGVLRKMLRDAGLAGRVEVDSVGTHGWHVGDPPDRRAIALAARRGYDLAPLRARKLTVRDFEDFDLIVAMDREHRADLNARRPPDSPSRVHLLLDFAPAAAAETDSQVPDPYYGGAADFERTLDLIEAGVAGLLEVLRREDS